MKLLVLGVDIYVVQWFMSFEILCLKRTSDYATHNYCSKISDRICSETCSSLQSQHQLNGLLSKAL